MIVQLGIFYQYVLINILLILPDKFLIYPRGMLEQQLFGNLWLLQHRMKLPKKAEIIYSITGMSLIMIFVDPIIKVLKMLLRLSF